MPKQGKGVTVADFRRMQSQPFLNRGGCPAFAPTGFGRAKEDLIYSAGWHVTRDLRPLAVNDESGPAAPKHVRDHLFPELAVILISVATPCNQQHKAESAPVPSIAPRVSAKCSPMLSNHPQAYARFTTMQNSKEGGQRDLSVAQQRKLDQDMRVWREFIVPEVGEQGPNRDAVIFNP